MSRAIAEALVLVNWKGVFYERYALHRHVTALEGDNGAGKTTVMIAAYVVLLPDMSLLRFTNLGESSATGGDKGVWGRLGASSRPAYAALDLRLPSGERVIAGVRLERRAEPSVELAPFLIRELGWEVQLQDVLLERGEVDAVPDLGQLRQLVGRAAGRLVPFDAAKDYFAALFELGVMPLRLAADSERTKLNEMLRTSMVGGISRALTGGLREFLLKEDTGLADTLKHMRSNLEECRRTRQQVDESARLEAEIAEVYDSGQRMFAAGLHGDRERASELGAGVENARAAWSDACAARDGLLAQADAVRAMVEEASQTREDARHTLQSARERRDRLKQALALTRRLEVHCDRLDTLLQEERDALAAQAQAELALSQARLDRGAAREAREAATAGLAEFQEGFAELQKRAGRYAHVTRRLAEAATHLGEADIAPDRLDGLLAELKVRLDALDLERAERERILGTERARAGRFREVLAALARLTGGPVSHEGAEARAAEQLQALRELDALAGRAGELQNERAEAQKHEPRQQRAGREARRLSTPARPLARAADVERAAEEAEETERALLQQIETRRAALQLQRDLLQGLETRHAALDEVRRRWAETQARAQAVAGAIGTPLRRRAALTESLDTREARRVPLQRAVDQQEADRKALQDEMDRLKQLGGHIEPALVLARDRVDGELLAGRFEDVSPDEAAELEARLGPLASAILVEDLPEAARRLSAATGVPDTIWLVGPEAMPSVDDAAERLGEAVLVREPTAWRLSRLSTRPVLGRRARERRIESLRAALRQMDTTLRAAQTAVAENDAALRDLRALLPQADLLDRADPAPELDALDAQRAAAGAALAETQATQDRDQRALTDAVSRRQALARLLGEAWLLDQPDLSARVADLTAQIDAAREARRRLDAARDDRQILSSRLEELRTPPLAPDALERLVRALAQLGDQRDRLSQGRAALEDVSADRIALGWSDAPQLLAAEIGLRPALEEQLRLAKEREHASEATFEAAERAATEARGHAAGATARRQSEAERHQSVQQDLDALGLGEVDEATLEEAERRLAEAQTEDRHAEQRQQDTASALAILQDKARTAEAVASDRERELQTAENVWRPAQARWERLEASAEARGVLAPLRADWASWEGRGSLNLWNQANTQRTLLLERLEKAAGGRELVVTLPRPSGRESDQGPGELALEIWLRVRDWIRRRVPAAIAEVQDPLEALSRLRVWLDRLRETLDQKEHELRGQSSDVARNIETQVRRARRHVDQLNRDLERVRFGSIRGVQIRVRNVERMSAVLRALQDGAAQELLFQSRMSIEDALDALFQRFGGGRTGGHRLLDYREYLSLEVEVRRQSSLDWELANPTRLSTGEAIGVGAAVMMVVLTAWERDANLLRANRSAGTLRLLFLDEANRLSQDNLGILFELCKNLELQLLIAAPEVATAQGNTTYRLARQVGEDGQEVVVVTGRRVVEAP